MISAPAAHRMACPFCGGSGAKVASVDGHCARCDGTGWVPDYQPSRKMGHLRHAWMLFLAMFRLSNRAVCEMSHGMGPGDDFHDYPDSTTEHPWHMHRHTCRRCGKEFTI